MSPDSGINELAGLSLEEQERQKQEWASELAKVFLSLDCVYRIYLHFELDIIIIIIIIVRL